MPLESHSSSHLFDIYHLQLLQLKGLPILFWIIQIILKQPMPCLYGV